MSRITEEPIDCAACAKALQNPQSGGFVAFEGWVRNHNEGKDVKGLFYEAYNTLADSELEKILQEAKDGYAIEDVNAIHRVGCLQIGEVAVWVGAVAAHRGAAFDACQYVIDQLKIRIPVWKQEQYVDGTREWVACHHCAEAGHKH